MIKNIYKKNKSKNLVLAGGTALNCVANGKVLNNTNFKNIFVPPFPDDSGAGLGAHYLLTHLSQKIKVKFNLNIIT